MRGLRLIRLVLVLCVLFGAGLLAGAVVGRLRTIPPTDHLTIASPSIRTAPRAVVVPHHMVARRGVTDTFAAVAATYGRRMPDRIVLISPNHFAKGTAPVALNPSGRYPNGATAPVDTDALRTLAARVPGAAADGAVFGFEHGIYEVLPLAADAFPDVPILAVALRDTVSPTTTDTLATTLAALPGTTLVVLSADFSHELDNATAQLHDLKSLDILAHGDITATKTADIDTPGGLRTLLGYTHAVGATDFHMVSHTNSAQLGGRDFIGSTTSHIAGYFAPASSASTPPTDAGTTIIFGGDVMLDRDVRTAIAAQNGDTSWLFAGIRRAFLGTDATVFNLEGPITDAPSTSVGSAPGSPRNYVFTFDPDMTRAFLSGIPNVVPSLGNNHVLNQGANGLATTQQHLTDARIPFIGAVGAWQQMHTVRSTSGPCVTIIPYNAFYDAPDVAATTATVQRESAACKVIVYAHWGLEYTNRIIPSLQNAAHAWIDAGATAVLGAHSHVVGAMEVYRDRPIFYSLGNLVFDQTFSAETQQGLLVSVRITDRDVTLTLLPTVQRHLAVTLAQERERDTIIGRLLQHAVIPTTTRDAVHRSTLLTFPLHD